MMESSLPTSVQPPFNRSGLFWQACRTWNLPSLSAQVSVNKDHTLESPRQSLPDCWPNTKENEENMLCHWGPWSSRLWIDFRLGAGIRTGPAGSDCRERDNTVRIGEFCPVGRWSWSKKCPAWSSWIQLFTEVMAQLELKLHCHGPVGAASSWQQEYLKMTFDARETAERVHASIYYLFFLKDSFWN